MTRTVNFYTTCLLRRFHRGKAVFQAALLVFAQHWHRVTDAISTTAIDSAWWHAESAKVLGIDMREVYEFRIPEQYADRLFDADEGTRLGGTVRKVLLARDDPRFLQVGELDSAIRATAEAPPRYFFSGWAVHYHYTKQELNCAEAFKLWPTRTFEPAGEECGTMYDESSACPHCGAGAPQISDLRLDLRKAPKKCDIARTIAGETIVSQQFAELIIDAGMKGFEFGRVRHRAQYESDSIDLTEVPTGREIIRRAKADGFPHPTPRFWIWLNRAENRMLSEQAHGEYAEMRRSRSRPQSRPAPVWYQLVAKSTVDVVPPTRTGISPFDDDPQGEYRCPREDTIGLNLLSELCISRRDFNNCECDLVSTKQYIGLPRSGGVLRPERLFVISPQLWRSLVENEIKGFRVEVAHLN
jgi:hypothetical protein